jgi:hypothetical protein
MHARRDGTPQQTALLLRFHSSAAISSGSSVHTKPFLCHALWHHFWHRLALLLVLIVRWLLAAQAHLE